jgi:hypothetical protein
MGRDMRDIRLFAPPDISPYGDGPEPAEGLFFTFDGLFWWIDTPDTAPIGFPNLTREVYHGPDSTEIQTNTHDNQFIKNYMTKGNRFEIGRVLDRWGWFVSTYHLHNQTTSRTLRDVDVVFVDDAFGGGGDRLLTGYIVTDATTFSIENLPITFDEMTVSNRTDHWSIELNGLYRTRRRHHGGFFEFFAGARYMEFDDTFKVRANGNRADQTLWEDNDNDGTWEQTDFTDFPTQVLADSYWNTKAENNIIGPQVGVRWFRQHGRWRLSAEGRFFAGLNNQNITQTGLFGSELDPSQRIQGRSENFAPSGYTNERYELEFSPGAEIRLDLHLQITRAISAKLGWTGFYLDGIARASSMVNYEVPTMGINMANNRQNVFVQGLHVGVEVNR